MWTQHLVCVTRFLEKCTARDDFEQFQVFQKNMSPEKLSTEMLSLADADKAIQTMVGSAVWTLDMMTEMRTAISKQVESRQGQQSRIKGTKKTQELRNPDCYVTIPIARFAASPGGVTLSTIDLLALNFTVS